MFRPSEQAQSPGTPFRIRRMASEDLQAVIELERAAFSNPWSPELLKRELGHEWSTILLVEEPQHTGSGLVGISIFWIVHDEVHLLNIATAPEHRRRGVARAALQATLNEGRGRKCVLATLEVRRTNEPAISLYRSFGFRPVGVRPNYYADEGEDAIVMVLDF
jgi:[ribosomal protein S18]-alanine N-acetyltransferase